MTLAKKLFLSTLMTASSNVFSLSTEPTTHIYNNIAIQNSNTPSDQINIYRAQLLPNSIDPNFHKEPKIGELAWSITAKDLHVSEETCLAIDASLCRYQPSTSKLACYDNCITNGPHFIVYDENSGIMYADAGTDTSGTGGTPRFLFSIDTKNKKIKYLNTIVAPYTAYLSPKGNYLVFESGWNEISVCNTRSGEIDEIQHHPLQISGFIKWLNDEKIEYNEIAVHDGLSSETTKIYDVSTKRSL
jgi:hypothetical protein